MSLPLLLLLLLLLLVLLVLLVVLALAMGCKGARCSHAMLNAPQLALSSA